MEKKGRQLVIGDIHGALRGLKQAWERAKVTSDDTVIFLGDYVDGWADMPNLIEHLIQLSDEYNCIFIKGNHDAWCETWLTTGIPQNDWLTHGGKSTYDCYNNSLLKGKSSHIMFFYKLHRYYIDDENRLFVHGGYTSEKGVEGEDLKSLMWNRDLYELAYLVENRTKKNLKERERTYPKRLKVYNEIFVGHTTTLWFNKECDYPLQALNMWNIDTGAGSNGRVTIMDVDSKEYWQSDKVRELYPDDPHNEFCKRHS